MISNKVAAILLFITSNIQLVASTSPSVTQVSGSSKKPALRMRKQGNASRRGGTTTKLQDTVNVVKDVEVQEGNFLLGPVSTTTETLPMLPDTINTVDDVLPRNNQGTTRVSMCQRLIYWVMESVAETFKRLMKEGKHWRARCLAMTINNDDLLNLTCSIVKTPEQYNGIASQLKYRKIMAPFYVHGEMGVVKEVIMTKSAIYDKWFYFEGGDLENALPLALKEGRHDRVIGLLDVRKGITAKKDEQRKRKGWSTSFDGFVDHFLVNLAPWKDGMAFKRFLTLNGDAIREKFPNIIYILCLLLVYHLNSQPFALDESIMLSDLIGQPSLLTSATFAKVFSSYGYEKGYSNFIKRGWKEAVEIIINKGSESRGGKLWRLMEKIYPTSFPGEHSPTDDVLTIISKHFPTKQTLENRWIEKNMPVFLEKLNNLFAGNIFPTVLAEIIIEYAG